jgi:hypothetical protein
MLVHALEEAADLTEYLLAEAQRRADAIRKLMAMVSDMEAQGYWPMMHRANAVIDILGGEAALVKYDEILGGAEDATVAPDPRDEPAISTLHKFEDGNSPEIESITTTAPTPGSLLRWVVLETGLMRYVEVHDTEDSEFDEAARLYETKRKAISPAPDPREEALRVAESALLHIQQRAEPLGIDIGDSITHLMATNALEAIRGAR